MTYILVHGEVHLSFFPTIVLSFFIHFSGLDIGLIVGGKNKSRSAYCVRNVKGNELAKRAPIFAQIRMIANTVRTLKRNLESSVFLAERVAFSRSLWDLGACFRASGIGARCVVEHAAVSAFQAFLAQLPANGPLRSTFPD